MKRQLLGQHFLNSNRLAKTIVSAADISQDDIVYEVGTGLGILTPLLCKKAQNVISIDIDRTLFENAVSNFSHIENLELQFGNGFKRCNMFSIFVSCLPYSQSRIAMEWLAQTPFSHGVIMVQREFGQKILSRSVPERRAISIIANHAFEITRIAKVGRMNFHPVPDVDSVLLKIRQKRTVEKTLIDTINKIFSYRRKTIRNVFKHLGAESTLDRHLDDLTDEEVISIAQELVTK